MDNPDDQKLDGSDWCESKLCDQRWRSGDSVESGDLEEYNYEVEKRCFPIVKDEKTSLFWQFIQRCLEWFIMMRKQMEFMIFPLSV